MEKVGIALGRMLLIIVAFFGGPLIVVVILLPICSALIANQGLAAFIAIFGGGCSAVIVPRLWIKWLERQSKTSNEN